MSIHKDLLIDFDEQSFSFKQRILEKFKDSNQITLLNVFQLLKDPFILDIEQFLSLLGRKNSHLEIIKTFQDFSEKI